MRHSREDIVSNWRIIHSEGHPLFLEILWKEPDQNRFTNEQRHLHNWSYEPEEKTVMVWVDQVRIPPDNRPGVFNVLEVVLLVPPADE